jgi:hypothetical protein
MEVNGDERGLEEESSGLRQLQFLTAIYQFW